MFRSRLVVAAALVGSVIVVFGTAVRGDDTKKVALSKDKLVGLWEVTKSDLVSPGSTLEFTTDGKFHAVAIIDKDKDKKKIDGTWTIDGDTIKIVMSADGKERTESITVTRLTDTELATRDEEKKVDEFKKVVVKK